MSERPADERIQIALRVDYEDADDLVADYTQNLSSGGACVASSREVEDGAEVRLALSFPGLLSPIRVDGIVRWHREDQIGIQFHESALANLEVLITRIRNRDPQLVKRHMRVLVVEDNPHIAQLLRHGLVDDRKHVGVSFEVWLASDGRQALEAITTERFDILIVDVYLPVLDGAGVIGAVRSKLGLDTPIIAVSGGGDPARRVALDAGASMFIDKPMRLKTLLERMREIMKWDAPR